MHQRPYCPLQCAPIRWLANGLDGDPATIAGRAAQLATELRFAGRVTAGHDSQAVVAESEAQMAKALLVEADDYCGGLSGGQRAKLELIRSVFLQPVCPPLLMLDEPFAALDAPSRAIIMRTVASSSFLFPSGQAASESKSSSAHRPSSKSLKR